ncbi:MAG: glycosyltransferase family 4 protein, partial [Sedimenticolaceae bacterium]
MRLLIWSQYFWPENFHINEVTRQLSAQGVEVTVLTGKPNYPEGRIFAGYRSSGVQREAHDGYEVIRMPIKERGTGSARGLILNYLSFVFSGYLVAPLALRGRQFDAVFVYAPSPLIQALPAILVAWLKGAPLILWVQDIWPDALQATGFVKNTWLLRGVEVLIRHIYRRCDSILIQSEGFRSSVEKLVDDPGKVRFFPNSAAAMTDQPSANASSGSVVAKDIAKSFSVVFAGNIGTVQSCETIVAAAGLLQKYPEIRFYLVGSGSMAETIANKISAERLDNVVMTGRVQADEIPGIYAAASVLLLSFQHNSKLSATIPSKLQGYLAAGKPIIASSDGEPARVLNKAGAGLTCGPGDPQALAKAVLELHEMTPEERDALGMNGQRYFMANFHLPDRIAE